MRAWLLVPRPLVRAQAGYSLFALLSPVDVLSLAFFDGFLVLGGFEVDDLARLSVT
jgi:hypothetical protein